MTNSMMVIFPYKHNQTWVFDDERMKLVQEPFVSGIPEMIDILVQDIANVDEGFKLLFFVLPVITAIIILVLRQRNGNCLRKNSHIESSHYFIFIESY